MDIIVIYFSLTGNTKKLAVRIYEVLKVKGHNVALFEVQNFKKKSFLAYCFDTIFEKEPQIEKIPSISKVDIVFIGSPVWVGKITPYIRKLIKELDLLGKKTFLFITYGTGLFKNRAMLEFEKLVKEKGGEVIGKLLIKGSKVEKEIEEIKKCLKEL